MNTSSNHTTGNPELPVDVTINQISTLQDVQSKKRCLQNLSSLLFNGFDDEAIAALDEDFDTFDIFDALIDREQLGSTGVGNGCALPHGRLPRLKKPYLAVLTLANPISFNAIDGQKVDIIIGLLAPEDDGKTKANERHLQLLATVAQLLEKKDNREYIRQEMTAQKLHSFITERLQVLWDKEVSE